MAIPRNLKERYAYIAPDGTVFNLDNGRTRVVLSDEGTGMPPIEYVTQRGPFQHGETVRDCWLRPRVVQLLVREQFCNRVDLWAGRTNLLNLLRPTHGDVTPGVLRKYLPNGSKRDLDVRIEAGPQFVARQLGSWDEFAYQEALRFIAHDPVYYDPTQHSVLLTAATGELVFPITFPITFESFAVGSTINYAGNWIEYPNIVITGPLISPSIRNVTTDEVLSLAYSVAAGETVTFDLSFGVKTVTNNSGTNLISYLTTDSDIATFHLHPGANQITILGTGESGDTEVSISWYDRYIGI